NDISSLIIDIREYQEPLIDEIINGLNKPENVIKNIPTFLLNEADCIVGHINIKDNGLVIGLGSEEEKEIIINLKEDELIHVEYSHKYDKKKFLEQLFHRVRLSHVGSWTDPQSQYNLRLLSKLSFIIVMVVMMVRRENLYQRHVPAFLGIHLSKYYRKKMQSQKIFERYLDSDTHLITPVEWRGLDKVTDFKKSHNDDGYKDDDEQYDSSKEFGWDNESSRKEVGIESFKIHSRPVTNGEYLKFIRATVNKEYWHHGFQLIHHYLIIN
ncbi:9818_t:CDS:2, partial [Entrophospora sp. SA101]